MVHVATPFGFGIVKQKAAPFPNWDSTQILPPCRSTIFLHSVSRCPCLRIPARCAGAGTGRKSGPSTADRCQCVVCHREDPFVIRLSGRHVYRGGNRAAKPDAVCDQILEDLRELHRVRSDDRQSVVRHNAALSRTAARGSSRIWPARLRSRYWRLMALVVARE